MFSLLLLGAALSVGQAPTLPNQTVPTNPLLNSAAPRVRAEMPDAGIELIADTKADEPGKSATDSAANEKSKSSGTSLNSDRYFPGRFLKAYVDEWKKMNGPDE